MILQEDIKMIIGTKGANIRQIRDMGVQAQLDENDLVIRLRGMIFNLFISNRLFFFMKKCEKSMNFFW